MKVTLLYSTPIMILDEAISMPHGKGSKNEDHAKDRMYRIINKMRHESVAEHCNFSFKIEGIPRYVLQELVRHRIASYTVKSSRYTLNELKGEKSFTGPNMHKAFKYVYRTHYPEVDTANIKALEAVRAMIEKGMSNDVIKPAIPEAYLTDLVMTINMRSLKNFLSLRTGKGALAEIHILADMIYAAIPEEYKFLLEDSYNEEANVEH